MKFKKKDVVCWKSQAQGYEKLKVGTVVEVVKAGGTPKTVSSNYNIWARRDHDSYVVKVEGMHPSKAHYWPKVSYLKLK